jgi:hypothetical protein
VRNAEQLGHREDPKKNLDPLPHQIRAVYGEMLPRQPWRFLLADDPGAGKTIMAGLLIKELIIRGDLKRCLIVPPTRLFRSLGKGLGRRGFRAAPLPGRTGRLDGEPAVPAGDEQ